MQRFGFRGRDGIEASPLCTCAYLRSDWRAAVIHDHRRLTAGTRRLADRVDEFAFVLSYSGRKGIVELRVPQEGPKAPPQGVHFLAIPQDMQNCFQMPSEVSRPVADDVSVQHAEGTPSRSSSSWTQLIMCR